MTFALIHGALGEVDQELLWYEKGYQDRSTNMAYALIMPLMNPELAGNARFQAIIDHMGIPRPAR